ncbi:TonB-dependent receptor [Rapidithrix thailandica]|uniref:TonB-dependent receptor n=1 Tax=Rapidithrix thailandica TaxID=413964 RepID=A0AAW9SBJ9_9BACT
MRIKHLLFTLFLSVSTISLWAQESPVMVLDSIEVATSRIGQTAIESGKHLSIIDAEEIAKLPVRSLDELFRYLPGVEVQSRGGFGVQSDLSIRGSTFSQVLVLIDGVRLNDPLTGHMNSNIPISPAEIERIEVLKGPGSSLFGSDAVGGIIHIITKTFSKQPSGKTYTVQGSGLYGEENLFSADLGGYWSNGKIKVGAGAMLNTSNGQSLPEGDSRNFDVKTVSGSIGWTLSDHWDLMFRTAYDRRNFNAKYFYTRSTFDEAQEETTAWWNHLKLRHQNKTHSTDIDFTYKSNTDWYLFNPDFPPANEHTTRYLTYQVHHIRKLGANIKLATGVQADFRNIESNDRGDHHDWHGGVYSILLFQPVQNLHVNTSLRADHDQNYGWELSPQLNLSYQLNKQWQFRGGAGKSLRAADYTERYISTNLPGPLPAGRNIGNPNLHAERAWSTEAGVDFFPASGISLKMTGFWRFGKNLIDYQLTPGKEIPMHDHLQEEAEYLFANNLEEVQTKGLEWELGVYKRLSNQWNVQLNAGFILMSTQGDLDKVSKYVSNHARHLANWQLMLYHPKFEWGLNGMYKLRDKENAQALNSQLNPDYMVWNSQMSYFILQNISLTFQVVNLFDEEYSDILGATMPGRWWMGGVKIRLRD